MLGTVKRMVSPDSEAFQDCIREYIGSRTQDAPSAPEDSDSDSDSESESEVKPLPEMWPLVVKVVVYCNAGVLSSGATFIDLPGQYSFPPYSDSLYSLFS